MTPTDLGPLHAAEARLDAALTALDQLKANLDDLSKQAGTITAGLQAAATAYSNGIKEAVDAKAAIDAAADAVTPPPPAAAGATNPTAGPE